jgi:hypothetical protein
MFNTAYELPIVELRQRRIRHAAVLPDPLGAQAPGLLSVLMR